jgi:hypothetical protein
MPEPTTPEPPEKIIHDAVVDQIEETLPEGPSPKFPQHYTHRRILFAFGALALTGLVVLLFIQGGPAAGAVGLAILFFYALFGSTPWLAGTLRAKEHKEVEAVVHEEMDANHIPQPPRTA